MGIISLHNTPTLIHTDTLGRGFYTIRYLSPVTDVTPSVVEESQTLDIEGNRLELTDGRGQVPLRYRYARMQLPCYQHSMDSGTQYTLLDVSRQPYHSWDAMDRETEILYDALRRPLQRITDGKTLDQYIYGETLTNPEDHNYRGQVYRTYDGSGMQQVNGYDFKGNPLSTQVQLLDDRELTDADWAAGAEPDLSTEIFSSSVTYDALNRPITSTDPGGNIQAYTYDKGGMLKTVMLNSVSYVNDIHYDAKGQRQAIWYGNSTKTSYTYDPETFRLRRLLTVNLSNNDILQDLHYWYDPVGNITEIQDDAQQTLFFNNSVVAPTQEFTYDALYRLIAAEGRELIGSNSFGANDNDASWQTSHKGDGNAVQRYTQHYTYDAVGNILELSHNAAAGAYTRTYAIAADSNRLLSTTVGRTSPPGSDTYVYAYDVRGNMATMPHLSSMVWNLTNELSSIAKGTMSGYYQYSGGQRVRKYVDKGSFKEERIYLGSFEIYRKFDHTSSLIIERTTVHVSDDTGRIAMLEKRTEGDAVDDNGTAGLLTRYIYSNHLQSASLELDGTGAIISYEEYHPYGTTSYQAMNAAIHAVAKRYRYTGKERDDESGLYYHGARYYIPWLCRWSAVDPLESEYTPQSPYCYCSNNPVNKVDMDGMSDGWVQVGTKMYYDSRVNEENVNELYGEKAKYWKVGDSYGSASNNLIILGKNGSFTRNGELDQATDMAPRPTINLEGLDFSTKSDYDGPNTATPNFIVNEKIAELNQAMRFIGKWGESAYATSVRLRGAIDFNKPPTTIRQQTDYDRFLLAESKRARHQAEMAVAGINNPVIGMFQFTASSITAPVASGYAAYDNYSSGNYVAGTFHAGMTLLAVAPYTKGIGNAVNRTGGNLWRVGSYSELKGLEVGLNAHHVGQKALMKNFVPGYNLNTAPSILVPEVGHTIRGVNGIVSRSTKDISNARQLLARDILELRRVYGPQGIPNEALQELIQLNKTMYPGAFIK